MTEGEKNRHVGSTNMNERSSRSHTIFRLIIESSDRSERESSALGKRRSSHKYVFLFIGSLHLSPLSLIISSLSHSLQTLTSTAAQSKCLLLTWSISPVQRDHPTLGPLVSVKRRVSHSSIITSIDRHHLICNQEDTSTSL